MASFVLSVSSEQFEVLLVSFLFPKVTALSLLGLLLFSLLTVSFMDEAAPTDVSGSYTAALAIAAARSDWTVLLVDPLVGFIGDMGSS